MGKERLVVPGESPRRREVGAYYTPPHLARLVARVAVRRWLENQQEREAFATIATRIRVLDPAVGRGVFLLAVLDELSALWEQGRRGEGVIPAAVGSDRIGGQAAFRSAIVAGGLYGIDIDAEAVAACRQALIEAACAEGSAQDGLAMALTAHIRTGDALGELPAKWAGQGPGAEEAKPDGAGAAGRSAFDIVIGNPPWGVAPDAGDKERLRERFGLRGILDSFGLFCARGIELLAPGGCLGMVLPEIILLKSYPFLRRRLLSELRITDILLLGSAFRRVTLGAVALVGIQEPDEDARAGNKIAVWRASEADGVPARLPGVRQSALMEDDALRFSIHLGTTERDLQRKLEEAGRPLGELLEAHEGIHSGNVRGKIFVAAPRPVDGRPLLLGRDEVTPFRIRWGGQHVRLEPGLVDRSRGEYANFGRVEWFAAPKIIVRRTGDFLLAVLDEVGYYCSNNLFVARLKPGAVGEASQTTARQREPAVAPPNTRSQLQYLVALLNSSALTWYFRSVQPRTGRPFAELKLIHLRRLPIVIASAKERDELAGLAVELAQQQAAAPPRGWKRAGRLWDELDEAVCRLYGLTENERAMVARKRANNPKAAG